MTTESLLSVVVPIKRDTPDFEPVHTAYRRALEAPGRQLQFIYVVDGPLEAALASLRTLKRRGEPIEILHHAHSFGEAAALTTGFRHAKGERILTLSEGITVKPSEFGKLLAAAANEDVVIARRMTSDGRAPGKRRKFEYAANLLFGRRFNDLRSSARVIRRAVADEITLYGHQHLFLPLIAESHGFTVKEVEVDAERNHDRPGGGLDLSLVLDLITAFFLIRFIKRPFRFFGGFGFAMLAAGGLVTAWLVFARLFLGEALVDRPALVLSSLMIVLGIQIISVGLIGEIITFSFTKEHKDYKVERIVD
jgi:glycosyltransferase involved in cell wall biosynthesis